MACIVPALFGPVRASMETLLASNEGEASEGAKAPTMTAGERLAAAKAARAARKAARRGKDAEQVEEKVLRQAGEAGAWAETHRKTIGIALIAGVVVVGALGGYFYYRGASSAKAAATIVEATATLDAPIGEGGDDKREHFADAASRDQKALERFRAILSDYPSAPTASRARLAEAAILSRQGDREAARGAYEKVLAGPDGSDPEVAMLALEGIASTLEAEERWDDATSRYEEIGKLRGSVYRPIADYHLARMALQAGKNDEAKEKLKALLESLGKEDAPELAHIREQAELRLRTLDPTAAPAGSSFSQEQLQEMLRRMQREQQGAGTP